jgi:membrane-bound lytic murein transglycosylase A
MQRAAFALALYTSVAAISPAFVPAMANEHFIQNLADRAALRSVSFDALAGWKDDDHLAVWRVFIDHCRAITTRLEPLRAGVVASAALTHACKQALALPQARTRASARKNFESLFSPFEIEPIAGKNPYDRGFLTGYYEPVVAGSFTRSAAFSEPVLGRPSDLITLTPEDTPASFPAGLASARRTSDGALGPYPERAAIENEGDAGDAMPLLYVRDGIELFMMQVQGSARIRLPDERLLRLTYAGRNGQPYTSIGRLLVERGNIPAAEMSLARLKAWVRANGQKPGEAGRRLMQENRSYVFFRIDGALDEKSGPVGAASIPLTRLRSIAVDRNLWPYGLPMWIDAEIPWRSNEPESFQRLMVAQDTGSAILGAARADIFFGTGARAGRLAGNIRHRAGMFVLLPKGDGVKP